jgi:hypothetical protein
MSDQDRIRQIQQRLGDLQDEADREHQRSAEQTAAARAAHQQEARSPVQPARRARRRGLWSIVALVLIVFVAGELAMTMSHFTGPDIGDAKRLGRATVLSCTRQGPVGEGFGYWDTCTADVVWDDGQQERLTVDKLGFFGAEEIGTTVRIGELGNFRSGRSLAREDLPPRPVVTAVGTVLGLIALIPLLLLLWTLWLHLRDGLQRLRRTGT